jgi:hypothetical protein
MARSQRDLMPLMKRLGWMALIWAMSVSLLGVVSLLIRWWLK